MTVISTVVTGLVVAGCAMMLPAGGDRQDLLCAVREGMLSADAGDSDTVARFAQTDRERTYALSTVWFAGTADRLEIDGATYLPFGPHNSVGVFMSEGDPLLFEEHAFLDGVPVYAPASSDARPRLVMVQLREGCAFQAYGLAEELR